MSVVTFEIINGKQVFVTRNQISSRHLVIMSHGFRGTSTGPARSFVNFERLLAANGISTLRFDQPNCGNSEGDFLDASFAEWIGAIVSLAQQAVADGFQVILLGQSMGATASLVAASRPELKDQIPAVLLWVPDPKLDPQVEASQVYEEAGEQYRGQFWIEAQAAGFMSRLDEYSGGIHLVYGEHDRYVTAAAKQQVMEKVTAKGQPVMVLANQDHSPWDFDSAQQVFQAELEFVKRYFK